MRIAQALARERMAAAMKPLFYFAWLLNCDVEFKEIAILVALAVLFAVVVRLSAGHLFPADLTHLISQ